MTRILATALHAVACVPAIAGAQPLARRVYV